MSDETGVRRDFGDTAVDALRARLQDGSAPEIDPAIFAERLAQMGVHVDAGALLRAAAESGMLAVKHAYRCPVAMCRRLIDQSAIANQQCPHCGTDYRETGDEPIQDEIFVVHGELSRLMPWLICVHGMNTRGEWQEEFSWRIANRFKYHAPVFIYKYGTLRFSVLVRWRHRMQMRKLAGRVRAAMEYAAAHGISDPPDVVVHSFGSQLFRLLLESDECKDLNFGRVIVVGGIIRPDFDWSSLIDSGRVQAVLCHCGGRDVPVRLAQVFIPGAGPSGRHGFTDSSVFNVMDIKSRHSDAFSAAAFQANLAPEGLWDRFWRRPLAGLADARLFVAEPWKPVWWPLRHLLWLAGLTVLAAVLIGALWVATIACSSIIAVVADGLRESPSVVVPLEGRG
jgi:hypothetical protein